MRALVTGAAGFVGSHLTEALLGRGFDIVAVDCFTDHYPGWMKRLNLADARHHPRCHFVDADLTWVELPALLSGVDYVFHQAAQPGVRSSWGVGFESYVRNNVLATQRLLEAARNSSVRKVVYASSSSVYGNAKTYPTREDATPQPVSPYGATKLAAENLCSLYWREFGLPVVSLRYFTAYGPRQRPDMAMSTFIRAGLQGDAIQVYGDGGHSRDFTYVDDVVAANLIAAEKASPGRIYNIGGGSEVTVDEIIRTLQRLMGGEAIKTVYQEEKPGDARRTAADTSLARKELGYCPRVGLEEGLTRQLAWAREQLVHPLQRLAALPATRAQESLRPIDTHYVRGPDQ